MDKKKTKDLSSFRGIVYGALLIVIMALPIKIFAIGQTTDPIIIKNALRGKEYQQSMIVVNTEKKDLVIGLKADGQIGAWTIFYKQGDPRVKIAEVAMKAGEVRKVTVMFSVPAGAPNGQYKGNISAIKKSDDIGAKEGSSTSVSQKIDREVTIIVNDKEFVDFDVSVIPQSYDLKKDEALDVRLIYDNRGNISIAPQAQFKIKKDDQTISNIIYPYPENLPPVNPGAIYEIPVIKIPTNNFEKGKYSAELSFSVGGKVLLEKKFGFSVDMFDVSGAAGLAGGIDKNNAVQGIGGSNLVVTLILAGLAIIGLVYTSKNRLKVQKIKNNDGKNQL